MWKIEHKAANCRVKVNTNIAAQATNVPNGDKGKDAEGWTVVKNRNNNKWFDGTCNYCKKQGH